MLKTFSCAFFGHREFCSHLLCETKLKSLILSLLSKEEYVEFLVERNGEFDRFVSSTIQLTVKNNNSCNHAHVLVLPYETAEYRTNKTEFENYYDEIEIFEAKHYKSAIAERNRYMIDHAELIICYVKQKCGGAYQALRYAQQQNKRIINLAE